MGAIRNRQPILRTPFEIMPMLEDIRVPLGMCYFQIEKFDQAIELFEGIDVEFLTENVLNNLGAVCIQSQSL